MDETALRQLLERVIEPEPPIGAVAQNGIRAGIRLRRRRRAQQAVAGAAAVAVTCGAVVAATSLGGRHGGVAASAGSGTVYVLSGADTKNPGAYVTPISAATNAPGTAIALNGGNSSDTMAVTPDGKTIYVVGPGKMVRSGNILYANNTVTPVSTTTGKARRTIPLPMGRLLLFGFVPAADANGDIVVAPDGKTVYVITNSGALTTISTATNTLGPSIRQWVTPRGPAFPTSIAITPDGKTLYVGVTAYAGATPKSAGPDYVIPVDTATDQPGQPIKLPGSADDIEVTPDGNTAYVIGGATVTDSSQIAVTPIATATDTAGPAVIAGRGYQVFSVVMTPDGKRMYIETLSSLLPFSTATGSAGPPVTFGHNQITALAAAPDGQTIYAASQNFTNESGRCPTGAGVVTPVATATSRPGKPVQVACTPNILAVARDSKTVYAGSDDSGHVVVTPIAAGTGQAGTPIEVNGYPVSILVTP